MTLPTSLWILGKPYRVYVGRKDLELARNGNRAEVSNREMVIDIRSDLTPEIQQEALLHEVFHALEDILMSSDGLREGQVHALSSGLFAVLRDNSWIPGKTLEAVRIMDITGVD